MKMSDEPYNLIGDPRYYHFAGPSDPKYGKITYWADKQTYCVWITTELTLSLMHHVVKCDTLNEDGGALPTVRRWAEEQFMPLEEIQVEHVKNEILQEAADDDWEN